MQDVASDLLSIHREHYQIDKTRGIEGKDGVTDCADFTKIGEKCRFNQQSDAISFS